MSEVSQFDLIRLAIKNRLITRLDQVFPTVIKKGFAKEMGWNEGRLNKKLQNAKLLDMEAVHKAHKALGLTPGETLMLMYNQYLQNIGEEPWLGDDYPKQDIIP